YRDAPERRQVLGPGAGRSFAGGEGGERQPHGERRAQVRPRALGLHVAAVQLDQMTNDREPESQTAVGTRARAVGLPEAIEDVRQELGRDAAAGVAHAKLRLGARPLEADRDASVARRELDRGGEEVPDHLLQAGTVSRERTGRVELRLERD